MTVNSGGILATGGATTQMLSTGSVTLAAGSTLAVTLNGTTSGTGYDQLNVTGKVSLSGATSNLSLGFTPTVGDTFTLIQNDGADPVVGIFVGLKEGSTLTLNGMTFQISYKGGTGNDVVLTRTF